MERVNEIDNKYIESSKQRFSALPPDLQLTLNKMLCILKEHEMNYENLAKLKASESAK